VKGYTVARAELFCGALCRELGQDAQLTAAGLIWARLKCVHIALVVADCLLMLVVLCFDELAGNWAKTSSLWQLG
jgi:hypothetical protein